MTLYPADIDNEELNALLTTIHNQESELETKDKEIVLLKAKAEKLANENDKLRAKLDQTTDSTKNNKAKRKRLQPQRQNQQPQKKAAPKKA